MKELLDELEQGIEMRVDRLSREWDQKKTEPDRESRKREKGKAAERMIRRLFLLG